MEFAVVKFTKEDDAIGVIPLTWVKEMSDSEERIMASSYYPPSKLKNVERLARKKVTPRIDWDLVETEIIHQYNCNRLFVVVGQLQETVADLTDVVKRLNEKINEHFNVNTRQERTDEKSYEVLGKIPVQSLEEMEELEKMMEKPQFKKQLFKVLTSVGGKDIKTMVYNCLRRLMSYNIAVEYSYSGNTAQLITI
ncbi:uncharacterized protein LOC120350268 [Nilaparvata lugens]|uniref:uncharacterized protein LOC120350268 n=1 Tax=Nilaparvata lugens TaxID=108931 RepID=UPI00193D022A|nr:uncharacterized protein LOC120350268 [Nilaparvata lugens]